MNDLDKFFELQAEKDNKMLQEILDIIKKDYEALEKINACLQADNDKLIAFLDEVRERENRKFQELLDLVKAGS